MPPHVQEDRNAFRVRQERRTHERQNWAVCIGWRSARGISIGQTAAGRGNGSGDDLSGRGTAQHLAKFIGSHTVGNSGIVESGGNIGIGTKVPIYPLHVLSVWLGGSDALL